MRLGHIILSTFIHCQVVQCQCEASYKCYPDCCQQDDLSWQAGVHCECFISGDGCNIYIGTDITNYSYSTICHKLSPSQASQAALADHTVYCATKGALDMVTKYE